MGDAAGRVVDFGSSELFEADSLVEDCFDHIGTGDEHVAGLVDHESEVCHCGRVDGSPAHGPIIAEICGITPEARTFRKNISAYPPRLTTPSCILAPPESFSPITGTPVLSAMSIILVTLRANISPTEPPNVVKSWVNR